LASSNVPYEVKDSMPRNLDLIEKYLDEAIANAPLPEATRRTIDDASFEPIEEANVI